MRALVQVGQPAARGGRVAEADAVVLDLDEQLDADEHPHHDLARPRMAGHVGQRLPDHCDRVLADVVGHRRGDAVDPQAWHEAERLSRADHLRVDRVPQAGAGRAGSGAEPEDRRTDVLDGLVEVVHRTLEPARDVRAHRLLSRALDVEADGEQPLDHHVVQVPRDALALLEHGQPGAVRLRSGHVERERELLRETGEAEQVQLRAGLPADHRPAHREGRHPPLAAAQRQREGPDRSGQAQVLPLDLAEHRQLAGELVDQHGGRSSASSYSVATGASATARTLSSTTASASCRGIPLVSAELQAAAASSHSSCSRARRYARAWPTATPAAPASATATCSSRGVKSTGCPSTPRFSVRYRLPKTSPRARTGTPRNECIGGWCAGNPIDDGCAEISCSRSGCGLVMT